MSEFPAYNVTVRLNAEVGREVFKSGITAPEIILLQREHGKEAVARATLAAPVEIENGALRLQLAERYGQERVAACFGESEFAKLPKAVPGFSNVLAISAPAAPVDMDALRAQIRAEERAKLEREYGAGPARAEPSQGLLDIDRPKLDSFDEAGSGPVADEDANSVDELLATEGKNDPVMGGAKIA